jgi:hypothetical protein
MPRSTRHGRRRDQLQYLAGNGSVVVLVVIDVGLAPEVEADNADRAHHLIQALTRKDERDSRALTAALRRVLDAGVERLPSER